MSEKEFEIYLSLLSRLLRLTSAQKASISDELRDHLEQRLEDLLQQGMSRDAAIQVAMDEFGDVNGLALDLTRVSRHRRQRIVVGSSAAVAVALVLLAWLNLFSPEHRPIAPPALQAQAERTEPAADGAAGGAEGTPAAPAVETPPTGPLSKLLQDPVLFPAFLRQTVTVEGFVDVPLVEFCEFLQSQASVPMLLNRSALDDDGVALDTPVTLNLPKLTLEEVLNHLSRVAGITWTVESGLVRITAPETERTLMRQFDLGSLIKQGHSLHTLQALLRNVADGWIVEGTGNGTVAQIGETIVVRQTFRNQRRIAQLFAALESRQPMTILAPCTSRDKLLHELQDESSVEFVDTPLEDALAFLADLHQIPILIHRRVVADDGVAADAPVSLNIQNRPLAKVLDLLLEQLHLTYRIRDGVVLITTVDQSLEDVDTVVYDVSDLAAQETELSQIAEAIMTTTDSNWLESDGIGGYLGQTQAGGSLVIGQTDQVHWEIQAMLDTLRRARQGRAAGDPAVPAVSTLVTRTYGMPRDVATDLLTVLPRLVSPGQWAAVGDEMPALTLITSTPLRDEVQGVVSGGPYEVQVIQESPVPNRGNPAAGAAAPPLPGPAVKSIVIRPRAMLVIHQTPQVHREIQKLLETLGIAADIGDLGHAGTRGGFGGMMGGGFGGMGGGMGGGGGFF